MGLIDGWKERRETKKREAAERRRGGFLRENIEALTVAIIAAITVKQFAFEAYKVPTMSMEPTIIGRPEGGDRIIVNKFVYMVRDPRRWEVFVFKYPLNHSVNYVKRVVGMPGEWLFIRGGDIYTAPGDLDHQTAVALHEQGKLEICRKPDALQDEIFDRVNVVPEEDRTVERLFARNDDDAYWIKDRKLSKGRINVKKDDEKVVFRAGDGTTLARFVRPARARQSRFGDRQIPAINNRRFDDWWRSGNPEGGFKAMLGIPKEGGLSNPPESHIAEIGDVRLDFEVHPESSRGTVIVEIRDGAHDNPLRLELAVTGSGGKSRFMFGSEEKTLDVTVDAETWTDVSVANADDQVIVFVDGDEVHRLQYTHTPLAANPPLLGGGKTTPPPGRGGQRTPSAPQPSHDLPHENAVRFGFDGGDASFREIDLSRDFFYNYPFEENWGATDFKIPEGHYLPLGDNSPDSLDGRAFKATFLTVKTDDGKKTMMGDAEGVDDDESIRAKFERNPFDNDSKFVDHYGNIHDVAGRIVEQRTEFRHYVPRDHVLGRAYITFWPPLQIGTIR